MRPRDLTWSGRRDVVWYVIRRLFICPAPDGERCIMGYNCSEAVHCPRRTVDGEGLWCRVHLADWLSP